MTVKELFNFIKGVRPGFAFTDAQLTVWLNEIEGHVQTDIWLLEPAVDETQTGLVEYDSTIDPETGEMVDANHELLVPFPWNKLYRYFLLMSIDLANGEYQRYANSYELFNEAYEEYAGWYAQHVSPANGEAITRGYYISAYQFAARGGYAGTEEEFYRILGHVGEIEAAATAAATSAEESASAAEASAEEAAESAEEAAERAEEALKKASIRKQSGQSVQFELGIEDEPLKSVTVNIEGYSCGDYDRRNGINPTKTNVRRIVGYTSATITVRSGNKTKTYTVNFPEAAGVVYSGTLDVTSGKLTVKRRLLTFTDSSGWDLVTSVSSRYVRYRYSDNVVQWSGDSSHFRTNTVTSSESQTGYASATRSNSDSRGELRIRDAELTIGKNDINTFSAWLNAQANAGTPLQGWYEYLTPKEYTVEPVEITEYEGENIIETNVGTISVQYTIDASSSDELYVDGDYGKNARAAHAIEDALHEFVPKKTILRSGGSGSNPPKFTQGTTYKGIPYSSQVGSGRMVLFDQSLESIFTVFKNPYADIYGFDYNKQHTSDEYDWEDSNPPPLQYIPGVIDSDSARVYAGAVCSTWVSWATNRPIYYTTTGILNRLILKNVSTVEDLEVGDAMYQTGHVALITGIKYKNGNVVLINVSEMWKPVFRSIWYTPDEWWTRYYDGGTKEHPGSDPFKVGRFEDHYNIRTFEPVHIVDDIITNKGDNVYFESGDDVWTWITDPVHTLILIAPNGTHSTIDYTTLPQKTISVEEDGVSTEVPIPVYNLKSILTSVGLWRIRGYHGDYESRITILNLNSITASAAETTTTSGAYRTTVTLTGYNSEIPYATHGCKLHSYQVLRMHKLTGQTDDAKKADWADHSSWVYPVPDAAKSNGYVAANGSDDAILHNTIASAPITINTSSAHGNNYSWYVRVYFDTGCGLAYKDTNPIMDEDRT